MVGIIKHLRGPQDEDHLVSHSLQLECVLKQNLHLHVLHYGGKHFAPWTQITRASLIDQMKAATDHTDIPIDHMNAATDHTDIPNRSHERSYRSHGHP